MQFRILGPLEVAGDVGPLPVVATKPRAVLAVLVLHANQPVSAERLALALWGDDAPGAAVKTVQVHVSRLRKVLGDPEAVTTTTAGYVLRVRPGELDVDRFGQLVEDGRAALAAGDPERAAALVGKALGLWRGPPLAEFSFEPFAQNEITRLREARLAALELRVDADLAAGRDAELVGELQQLADDNPVRERFAGQLMLALYRSGRQTESLAAYATLRRTLVEQIGAEPGPELRRLHETILRQDASLQPVPVVAAALPRELDWDPATELVGRSGELAWLRGNLQHALQGEGRLVAVIGAAGTGKRRLAAELAREAHGRGVRVLYANAADAGDAEDAVRLVTAHAHAPARGTLVVIDDADAADAQLIDRLQVLKATLEHAPVLVVVCGRDDRVLGSLDVDEALALGALEDVESVRAIAARYMPGRTAAELPADWLLESSGGIPRRVHEIAGQWARDQAATRVESVAGRAATGRAELRSIESELEGSVTELQAAADRAVGGARLDSAVVCPFKGLASFEAVDADYFFGRERLVAELAARLVGEPLLGIVGASGSGKSSVLRAGLLPALATGLLPGSERWTQMLMRPGAHPLGELSVAMAAVEDRRPAILVVDQLEEVFTSCADEHERATFIGELASLAGEHCSIVIALRADYYGRLASYSALSARLAANHVLVPAMGRAELRRAIERPAQRAGLRVEPELADALVADVENEPGALPLLSAALLELWQRRDGRALRLTDYEHAGGVRGAVARLAEGAFAQLDHGQKVIARDVLLGLITEGAEGTVERRRVALTELEPGGEEVARVVALLTDRRLLSVGEGTIELAHEALAREWPRLRDWIEEERGALRTERRLANATDEWLQIGRDDGAVYRGVRLEEALEWQASAGRPLRDREREFLAASVTRRDAERVFRRRRLRLAFGGLSAALLTASTPDSRYIYVRQRSYTTHIRPRPRGRGTFATVVPTDIETWFARDGSERIERYHELWDQATYPTDQDRADAQAAGSLFQPPDDRRAVRYRDTRVGGFTVAKLRALPINRSALRARLERADLGYESPSPLVTVTGLVLGSPLTPPHVRAAAFAVLRDLHGAKLVPGAKDPMGRSGAAVEFNDDAWRTMYIFDPNTSELIATRSIGKTELPGRNITDWILTLDSAGVDRAPNAINPVVMPDGTTYVPSSNEPTPPRPQP